MLFHFINDDFRLWKLELPGRSFLEPSPHRNLFRAVLHCEFKGSTSRLLGIKGRLELPKFLTQGLYKGTGLALEHSSGFAVFYGHREGDIC